jgi:pimeloyl-ACP methyl ester carboxylesterase
VAGSDRRGSRWKRLGLRVLLYGGALVVGLPFAFSLTLTRGLRQPTLPAPAPFEELRFDSQTGERGRPLALRAWLLRPSVPAARPAVVVVHGLGDSVESFVGAARRLAVRGHPVLLLDLRGHGGSGDALTTLGAHERGDVRAALGELRGRGLGEHGFVLLGNSMGAVAVLLAAAGRDDVRAVIAEAPFDSYRETVAHHARLFYGLPRWLPLIPWTIALTEWRAAFDADDVDAVAAAGRIDAPLLLIADGDDPRMPERIVRRVFDAHAAARPGRTWLWVAPGAPHSGAGSSPDYWPRVFAFLDAAGA